MRGETVRFWLPAGLLVLFAAYSGQKLIRAHVDPEVDSINYVFRRKVPARRGTIYDVKGTPLAKSVPVWEYRLDPVALTNRVVKPRGAPRRTTAAILKTVSRALGVDYAKLLAGSRNAADRYQYLTTSSDMRAHDIVANSSYVSGVAIVDKQVRQYLQKRRLSHVIGSVNAESTPSAGIELKCDRLLRGFAGEIIGMKDARGNELFDKRIQTVDPTPGSDVYLTVDNNIQHEVETALADGIREFGAGSGWCVVLDVPTGAVLAMASNPDFHPLTFGNASDAAKLNRACAYTYEPGSVMKVITAAAAFDSGRANAQTRYSTDRCDERYYRLPGDGSHKWEPTMTVGEAIVHSSNIVIGKLGYDLGAQRLWSYMRAFGFGEKTGVGLPGEECGILPNWKRWDKVKWSRAPIGQGVAVTAIQIASAYQAIANDGQRMKPYIVDRVVDAAGVETKTRPEPAGCPVKASTARQLREVMKGVATKEGTARRAAVRGYSVAGKTGTAQKVINGRYSDSLFRATFCGMIPATSPRLVILVTLDFDQRTKFHQGGNSAGPVFRRIATAAMRYLEVTPDRPEDFGDDEEEDEFDKISDARAQKYGIIPAQ